MKAEESAPEARRHRKTAATTARVMEDGVNPNRPIAVFDSGLGGLSVVRALRRLLPQEEVVYFGDTARVPYGMKTRHTVARFALEDARFLLRFDPKLIVVACNTVSALALPDLEEQLPVPVVGVVEPGADAAVRLVREGTIAVLGTEATVSSHSYVRAIHARAPHVRVIQKACPLFVSIVEEGRPNDDRLVRFAVEDYLAPIRSPELEVVVLGCTHYPLLRGAISEFLGEQVQVVESGQEIARVVHALLSRHGGLSRAVQPGSMRTFVSDNPARFARIGSRFLEHEIQHVELVEAEQYIASALAEPELS